MDPNRIRHEMFEMVMARVSAIACGYEDANDLDRLRHDPLMKLAVGRCPESGERGTIMWQPISSAPFDRDLELAVIDGDGPHALVFPCRRVLGGWTKAETKERIEVRPTHWRPWARPT